MSNIIKIYLDIPKMIFIFFSLDYMESLLIFNKQRLMLYIPISHLSSKVR